MTLIIDRLPLIDYVSLSAYDDGSDSVLDSVTNMINRISQVEGTPTSQKGYKIGKYEGRFYEWPNGTAFIGHGWHDENLQWLAQFHGYMGQILQDVGWYNEKIWSCSRLDIQCTIPYDGVTMRQWLVPDEDENLRLYEGRGDGTATVYVGSESSDRFWRIYLKRDIDGIMWKRFEVQLGKKLTRKNVPKIKNLDDVLQLYVAEFGKMEKKINRENVFLSKHDESIFNDVMRGVEEMEIKPESRQSASSTWEWLKKSVYPAIMRVALKDSQKVTEWLKKCIAEIERREKLQSG